MFFPKSSVQLLDRMKPIVAVLPIVCVLLLMGCDRRLISGKSFPQVGVAGGSVSVFAITHGLSGDYYLASQVTGGSLVGSSPTGIVDSYVIAYSANGIVKWTQQLGATSAETRGVSVATDSSDNVYFTGSTTRGLSGETLTGTADAFLAKYNSAGVFALGASVGSFRCCNSYV